MIKKHWSFFLFSCLICFSLLVDLDSEAAGATYYVDFQSGSDTNNGTATPTPWKHCPGDSNATGNANRTLAAGDTVNFKGGVKYRGAITVNGSGTAGNPITFKTGAGWGMGKAIVTGAELLNQSWTQCSSQAVCRNNPNWANIYYTTRPTGMTWDAHLRQDGVYDWWAQSPNPSDRYVFNNLSEWYRVPYPYTTKVVTSTYTTDPSVFTSSDSTFYDDAWLVYWAIPNELEFRKITSYNPATNTVYYAAGSQAPYTDRDMYYMLLNHPAFIDQAGEYAVSTVENRIYLWPQSGSTPNATNMELPTRTYTMYAAAKNYLTIDGLYFTGTSGKLEVNGGNWSTGGAVTVDGVSSNITITNCTFEYLTSMTGYSHIYGQASGGLRNSTISNNTFQNSILGRGMTLQGDNLLVDNNTLYRIGRTGIYYTGTTNSKITRNSVTAIKGTHGNALSVYTSSNNILIDRNAVYDSPSLLTYETSSNLTVTNNLFDGYGVGQINSWGGMSGNIIFLNNTMVRGSTPIFRGGSTGTYTFINNIVDGGYAYNGTRTYNIYLSNSPASLNTGEKNTITCPTCTLSSLFTNSAGHVFSLKAGSAAIDSGAPTYSYGVTTDILGIARPQGSAWDIGAYEYQSGVTPPDTTPTPPRILNIN